MAEVPVRLNDVQAKQILEYAENAWTAFPYDEMRLRFEGIDKTYAREDGTTSADERLQNSGIKPVIVPVIQPQVDTLATQMIGMFLKGQPIFSVSSSPENDEAATQINAVLKSHSQLGAYPAEFIPWIRHASRYNLNVMEVDWAQTSEITYANSLSTDGTAAIQSENYSYNKLKCISPYNAFFDTTVRPAQVHKDGEYAGYHELVNRIQLKKLLAGLDSNYTRDATKAFESTPQNYDKVFAPEIIPISEDLKGGQQKTRRFNWDLFFGLSKRNNSIRYQNRYVITTLYMRILPSDINLKVAKANTPRIYKAIIVNSAHLIYFEEQTSAHGMLPLVFGQISDDLLGMQNKSFTESLMPIQRLVTQLHTARVADLARATADRGIFDPMLIDSKTINSPNPSAKMPIKPFGYGKNLLQAAFWPVPYRNETAGNLMQEAALVAKYGEDIGGLNQVQRGNFVKGNKTLGEFQEIMGNADEKCQVLFMILYWTALVSMQEMIKSNILQYQPPKQFYDPETKQIVEFTPDTVRKARFAFDMADGLRPQSLFRNPEAMTAAFQFIASSPQLQQDYDLIGLFAHIFNVRGATDLNSFRLTAAQKQQRLAQMYAQNVANNPANTAPQVQQPGAQQ